MGKTLKGDRQEWTGGDTVVWVEWRARQLGWRGGAISPGREEGTEDGDRRGSKRRPGGFSPTEGPVGGGAWLTGAGVRDCEHVSLDVAGRSPEQTLGTELDLPASWGRGWRAHVLIRPGMIPEALKAGASPREKLREMKTGQGDDEKSEPRRKVKKGSLSASRGAEVGDGLVPGKAGKAGRWFRTRWEASACFAAAPVPRGLGASLVRGVPFPGLRS